MPSAVTSKPQSAGTKRKADSSKSSFTKKSKVVSGASKKNVIPLRPVQKDEFTSEEDVEDSSEDGGVLLEPSDNEDEIEIDNDEERTNKKAQHDNEGIHPDRIKAKESGAGPNGMSSREAHAKQKLEAQQRKAAKPLAEQLARTKKIWERLRIKSAVPRDERKALVAELFEIITGRIKDFVLKHDAVRVVQTAIKYATPEQKRLIANELTGTYRQLAESKYAKFLIGKLLVHGDNEIRDLIVPEFYGHVRRMIKHPDAAWILDDIYRGVASRQQKATILREWYGAEFSLFKKDNEKVTDNLSEILATDAAKRGPIMRSLLELINQLIQKKTAGFTLLHDAMLQYFLNAKPGTEEVTEYLEIIKGDEEGDLLKNLAFTQSGARVVCLALAHGTAKDRKQILKTYKETFPLMAYDPHGHLVILTAYEVIDDTVLTSKSIFPELLSKDADKQRENIMNMVSNTFARTTLLYPFEGRSKSLFPNSLTGDLEILAEIDSIRLSTSKKDADVRRQELMKALCPQLLAAIIAAPHQIVSEVFGCQLVTDVMFGADGDKSTALHAIAQTASGDPTAEILEQQASEDSINDHKPPQSHVAASPSAGKMLKSLIAGGRYDPKLKAVVPVSPPLNFADILYPVIQDHIIAWATGPSSFVVVALLETATFASKDKVLKTLREGKPALEQAALNETAEQKAKAAELAQSKSGKGKKKSGGERNVGNMGSKMLLAML